MTNKTAPSESPNGPSSIGDGPNSENSGNWAQPYTDKGAQNYGEKIIFDPDFQGPVKKRSCTDVVCLLGFIAFLFAWAFVGFIGLHQGDINKVIYPTDSLGRVCGQGELRNRPFLTFFDLTRCLNPGVLAHGCITPQVCVHQCPTEMFSGYALAKQGQDAVAKSMMKAFCAPVTSEAWDSKSALELIKEGSCPAWILPSRPILGRCLPIGTMGNATESGSKEVVINGEDSPSHQVINAGTLTKALTALGAFLQVRDFAERISSDLADTWWMIGLAYIGATIVSFLWILFMRFFAGIMIWTSIILIFVLVGGTLGYSVYRYSWIVNNVENSDLSILDVNFTPDYLNDVLNLKDTWMAFIVILSIICLLILLILIALRQRIQIAIRLIEQGSKAVAQMFSTLFFPVLPFILHLIVVLVFVGIAMLLSSVGKGKYTIYYESGVDDVSSRLAVNERLDASPPKCNVGQCVNPETNATYMLGDPCHLNEFKESQCEKCVEEVTCQFVSYTKWGPAQWMQWFNLFGFFWAMSFVSAFSELVLAGVFATWYWTWDKEKVPCCTLMTSLVNASIYHLGTVAFGSLIIAIIRMIRAIVDYIDKKLSQFNNDLTRCLICLCKCCLWCLEKFMRFINRNAYIMCAINSTNFCVSAKDAFNLLMRNLVRVVVLNKVVDFLLFLGKLVVMAGVGAMSYFVFSGAFPELNDSIPTLNYFVTPVVTIIIGTYFITSSFFGVYQMAVDTLFLCFLEDMERNDGTPSRPYFMSKGLQKVVGKMQKFNTGQVQVK